MEIRAFRGRLIQNPQSQVGDIPIGFLREQRAAAVTTKGYTGFFSLVEKTDFRFTLPDTDLAFTDAAKSSEG